MWSVFRKSPAAELVIGARDWWLKAGASDEALQGDGGIDAALLALKDASSDSAFKGKPLEVYLTATHAPTAYAKAPVSLKGAGEMREWLLYTGRALFEPSGSSANNWVLWWSDKGTARGLLVGVRNEVLERLKSAATATQLGRVAPLWALLEQSQSDWIWAGTSVTAYDGELAHSIEFDVDRCCASHATRAVDWLGCESWYRRRMLTAEGQPGRLLRWTAPPNGGSASAGWQEVRVS